MVRAVPLPSIQYSRSIRSETDPDAAGGQAVDSKMRRMMEVVPENIHDKSGIFMGSYDEIEKIKSFHK